MMKVAIVVPYFGKLPGYFQIFLDSCKYNTQFEWLIFSNDNTRFEYPDNVQYIEMTFEECKKIVQSAFDFEISLKTPQKLCDYKCAYGYIFQEYIKEYDWWGHCDLDQVFGDLGNFITPERLEKYDKIYSLGHLTLYRNNQENNQIFKKEVEGKYRYKEVFKCDKCLGFDEWLPENVNDIFMTTEVLAIYENDCADVNPYSMAFRLVYYDVIKRIYLHSHIKNSIFMWEQGKIFQLYLEQGKLCKREFPYVHLQKRKMKDCRTKMQGEKYYIIPNCFVNGDKSPIRLLKKSEIWSWINIQYIKVKYNNLKYRLRTGDWKFSNVFK